MQGALHPGLSSSSHSLCCKEMQRKAIIFGGGGQLGVELCRELERRQWLVQKFDRQSLDVTDSARVESAVAQAEAQVVINAAAYNQVDIAEREPLAAYQANALAVRNLAMACRQADARLVHYSTDYVFDGTKGSPYVETDTPHPLGAYAVSKLAGELYAQAYLTDPLIIRTSGVFGPGGMFTPRGNFVELMLRLAKNNNPIRVVADICSGHGLSHGGSSGTRYSWVVSYGWRRGYLLVRLRQTDLRAGGLVSRTPADR